MKGSLLDMRDEKEKKEKTEDSRANAAGSWEVSVCELVRNWQ